MTLPHHNWPLDHIGIAVLSLDNSINWYQQITGAVISHREYLSSQGVELAFLTTGKSKIELLESKDPNSALGRFVAKRGPGLHHICYSVADITLELGRLNGLGVQLIDSAPRNGAENTQIAFIHPSSCGGVLVELCQYPIKP